MTGAGSVEAACATRIRNRHEARVIWRGAYSWAILLHAGPCRHPGFRVFHLIHDYCNEIDTSVGLCENITILMGTLQNEEIAEGDPPSTARRNPARRSFSGACCGGERGIPVWPKRRKRTSNRVESTAPKKPQRMHRC